MTAARTWTPYVSPGGGSVVGDLRMHADVGGPRVGQTRPLVTLLPPSYPTSPNRSYPVVLLHDGQNLFDASTGGAGEWEVDETMARLAGEGIEAIVVGVPHAGDDRALEYTPWTHPDWGGGGADAYLAFLVETVLPLVRASFRVDGAPERTVVGGSSLGGLVSLYALLARPDVFGRALVMSPAFWWSEDEMIAYARERATGHGRIWMDAGDAEWEDGQPELARLYVEGLERMREVLVAHGYDETTLRTLVEAGGRHRESAWARRLPDALRFLLGPS